MTKYIYLTIALFLNLSVNAQNQHWTATAIDGNTIDIAAMVDSGRTVLVDISAHWCLPCWDWHQKGIMEKIYEEFGPNGTDDVRIIFVDADPGSNMALLQGAGAMSTGNWLADTPYPIIGPNGEGAAVRSNYTLNSYPSLFFHCPGDSVGVVTPMAHSWEEFLSHWKNTCPTAFNNGVTDAMLLHSDKTEFCPGSHPVTELFNQGFNTLYSATIELRHNGTLLDTKYWTGSLASFQYEEISFDNYVMTTPQSYEKTVIVSGDIYSNGNTETDSLSAAPEAPGIHLTLDLQTDGSGFETKWKLFDDRDSVIASNPVTNYIGNHFYTYDWTLTPNTCYNFILYDTINFNGICCDMGQGFYRIRDTADTLNSFIHGGHFIKKQEQRQFYTPSVNASINENVNKNEAMVYPNPTDGIIKIILSENNSAFVSVVNMLGENVLNRNIDSSDDETINLKALPNGVYWVIITSSDDTSVSRIILSK